MVSGVITCCLSAAAIFYLRSRMSDSSIIGSFEQRVAFGCSSVGEGWFRYANQLQPFVISQDDEGSWIRDSALIFSKCKEVPWYLDDGTGRVHVVGARDATGFVLTDRSERFEESGGSRVRGGLDNHRDLKMLGVKRIEWVLPTGTRLTVVGEAVKDYNGSIRIQRPRKDPFYVSDKTVDQLIANLREWSRWYLYASMGLSGFGVYFLAEHAFQYIMERWCRWKTRKRVLNAAAKKAEHDEQAENRSDGTSSERMMPDLCVICLEHEYNSVFIQCGHMCCCMTCSSRLTSCPLCRSKIDQVVRTFRH